MSFDLDSLVRPNIRSLTPYSSARSEFDGIANVFLDANENAFGSPVGGTLNRYPDPLQRELKEKLAELKGVGASRIFIGNGSDEAIDLLLRIFCRPGTDACITCPPTYGMYRVAADINDVQTIEVPLTQDFDVDVSAVLGAADERSRLLFLCSPNNPTGNILARDQVTRLAEEFSGVVVVDEAYIDFADDPGFLSELDRFPNLVVLQTLSKAWGLAGARIGIAYASEQITALMNATKPPYNVSSVTQEFALKALAKRPEVEATVRQTVYLREALRRELENLDLVEKVHPSEANFLLVRVKNAIAAYRHLLNDGIVVRDRSNVRLCEGCIRITVGTENENQQLVASLKKI